MRYSDGGPDAHDNLRDRPRSVPLLPQPKHRCDLTVGGISLLASDSAQPGVRAMVAATAAEDDPARVEREGIALDKIHKLEAVCRDLGLGIWMGNALVVLNAAMTVGPDYARRVHAAQWDKLQRLIEVVGNPAAVQHLASRYYLENSPSVSELMAKYEKELADARG